MKRTRISINAEDFPADLREILCGADIYDSSCSPDARVYFVDKGKGYYLKVATSGTLSREAKMTEYFHSIGLGVRVISYVSSERDYLLTERALGEDLTSDEYLGDPVRLAEAMGRLLRELHDRSTNGCPVVRTPEYLNTVRENHKKGIFDTSLFGEKQSFSTADEAFAFVEKHAELLRADVLIHGDFCLPNIILDDWQFSKFIDVGCGGIGDRHIDLFWGTWTLNFNLGTDEYRDVFFDAYGRELIDPTILRVIEAAECFG
jgi:kanamycin kinase